MENAVKSLSFKNSNRESLIVWVYISDSNQIYQFWFSIKIQPHQIGYRILMLKCEKAKATWRIHAQNKLILLLFFWTNGIAHWMFYYIKFISIYDFTYFYSMIYF